MATVVESEEVKTDEEKAVKKVVDAPSYNYKYLCLPSMPWSRGGVAPPQFLGKDAWLPLLLALVIRRAPPYRAPSRRP